MSEYDELKQDIRDLRGELNDTKNDISETKKDIETIKLHLTNHIPHILETLQASVTSIDSRLQPFETKATKVQGVSEFVSIIFKIAAAIAALAWTVMEIVRYFTK